MNKLFLLAVTLLVSVGLMSTADATLYKWVDDKGTTHYDQTIPPEYAAKSSVQLNDKGRIEKNRTVETAAEHKANEAIRSKKLAEEAAVRESKRRDSALLNTYTTEKEIDLARDRNLQQVESRQHSFTTMLESAKASKAELLKEQDQLNQQKRTIPPSLLDDIKESEARVAKAEKNLALSTQELAAVKNKFETDKRRFKELKGN
ncbi:MAG: hypothetical protein RLZZ144_305 [Pseudomonadota bacterium]|jgi:uncharacterized protein YifN (PemK superfamily)